MASPFIKLFTRSQFLARALHAEQQRNLKLGIFIMLGVFFAFTFFLFSQHCLSDNCDQNIGSIIAEDQSAGSRHVFQYDENEKQHNVGGGLNKLSIGDIQTFGVGKSGRKNGNRSGGYALK